jgi:glutathione-specific gamma-glutamylcyclotransferase
MMNTLRPQPLRLTPDICALVRRTVDDPGPAPGLHYLSDDEYRALIAETLAKAPNANDIWVFAYGSLIWKPAFEYVERRLGTLKGWHRGFCLKTTRWRGTPDRPGLMMALQRGGQCQGVAYKLNPETVAEDLQTLFRRELGVKPLNQDARWLRIDSYEGDVCALTFTANATGQSYVGKIPLEETAAIIADAVGVWGSCADYLYETTAHLEDFGIRDTMLRQLGTKVAQAILSKNRVST